MADERDKLTKRPVPAHVRAQTAQPVVRAPPYDPAAPNFEIGEIESKTPVFGDPLQRVEYRQKRNSQQMFTMREQLDELKKAHSGSLVTMTEVKTKAEVLAAMLERVLEEQVEQRKAREEREANRETEKLKQKTESKKITMSIVAPTVTAFLAGIAAVIAAIMAAR